MHKISFVTADADLLSCWPALKELRPHIADEDFLPLIKQIVAEGAQVIRLEAEGVVPAVSVIRTNHYLHRGKNIYIDDLVCMPAYRGRGYASALLEWIKAYALAEGCQNVHLDSGYHRKDAHRLYLKSGYVLASHHFELDLTKR